MITESSMMVLFEKVGQTGTEIEIDDIMLKGEYPLSEISSFKMEMSLCLHWRSRM